MTVFTDLSIEELVNHAVDNEEGILAANKAIHDVTGKRTGRSPKDRFIVKEPSSEKNIDWGVVNQPIEPEKFHALWKRCCAYIESQNSYVSHLHVGADDEFYLPVKVHTEYAWHNLF